MARLGTAELEVRVKTRGLALVHLLLSSLLGYLHELAQIVLMLAIAYGVVSLAHYFTGGWLW